MQGEETTRGQGNTWGDYIRHQRLTGLEGGLYGTSGAASAPTEVSHATSDAVLICNVRSP